MILRDATPADAPAIAAVYRPAVETGTASFEEVAPDAEEMGRRLAAVLDRRLPWLVAEEDGGVVGYAYASPFRERSAYRFTAEDSVYVAPGAQGRGVGRALLQALIERCSGRELRQMIGACGGGEPASIGLHERCGFRRVGAYERVGFKFGRELDVVLMQRALS